MHDVIERANNDNDGLVTTCHNWCHCRRKTSTQHNTSPRSPARRPSSASSTRPLGTRSCSRAGGSVATNKVSKQWRFVLSLETSFASETRGEFSNDKRWRQLQRNTKDLEQTGTAQSCWEPVEHRLFQHIQKEELFQYIDKILS